MPSVTLSDDFCGDETTQFSFFRVPSQLVSHPLFKCLSADSKLLYKAVEKPWNNPFSDVSEGDWYYEAVRFVQENGLMNGYSDGRFGANDTLSRAQLAQILFKKEGRPAVSGGGFNDVDSGA